MFHRCIADPFSQMPKSAVSYRAVCYQIWFWDQLYIIFMLIYKIWDVPTFVWERLHQFSDNNWFCFVRFQSLLIFIALCFARDEVYWLLRHNDNPPQQKSKGKSAEDLVDRQLPELLFHMEELRGNSTEPLLTDW